MQERYRTDVSTSGDIEEFILRDYFPIILQKMSTHPILLFDGVCNLCNSSVQYVIRHDPHGRFKFASLQSVHGQQLLKDFKLPLNDLNSFVLIHHGEAFTRSTAALKVCRYLHGPVRLLYGFIIVPRLIRDAVYKVIAKNRYKWFGKRDECMIPSASLNERFLN